MIEVGIKGKQELIADIKHSASVIGSGNLELFSTPSMIALMENTAASSIAGYLDEAEGSVGTALNIRHLAATPLGMKVCCESELIEVDRKRLIFEVKAFDERGLIGEGTHERFIVNNDKFMAKVNSK